MKLKDFKQDMMTLTSRKFKGCEKRRLRFDICVRRSHEVYSINKESFFKIEHRLNDHQTIWN